MLIALLAGCASALVDDTPYVVTPRVLAVRAEPAEVEPGDDVRLVSLYADASGALATAPVDWAFCTALKPLAELGPVAPSCLDAASPDLIPIGSGLDVSGVLPADACSRFGPNPPPPAEGEAAGRPTDPDVTGGYYQPAVGFPEDESGITLVSPRVRCGLANVAQETYVAWNQRYHSNENPTVEALFLARGGETVEVPADSDGAPPAVAPGEDVTLSVSWPVCSDVGTCGDGVCSVDEDLGTCAEDCANPVGCGGAETYLLYDPDTQALGTRREAVSATWFATGGTFDEARNGRAGDEVENGVENGWQAPEDAGEVWIGVVLRDERGGVAFGGYRLAVSP